MQVEQQETTNPTPTLKPSQVLWGYIQIANYAGVSVGHVKSRETRKPGFPKRVKNLQARWVMQDVINYYTQRE